MRRVIRDEFESFGKRLAAEPERAPLDHLLHAVDLVAIHYGAEPDFYRGLFNAVLGAQATPSRAMMQEEGVLLWGISCARRWRRANWKVCWLRTF